MAQEGGNFARHRWQQKSQNFRQTRTDLGTDHWIVVEKYKTIQGKPKFLRQRDQVLRLRLPIDSPGHEIPFLQQHFAARIENLQHFLFIVLAAERDQHAAALLCENAFLKNFSEGFETYPCTAILTDNTAPQSIIAIEHDDLTLREL